MEKIISKNFLKEYVPSVQVSAEYGSRLQTYLRNAVLIMQKIPRLPTIFCYNTEQVHYAITNHTAAEIVYNSADNSKENMGLTTWKNAPDGRILKSDVTIAKNYLDEKQIRRLERTVSGYFDYVEDLIEDEYVFTMEDFSKSVNEFLSFRRYKILENKGKISKHRAEEKAMEEYTVFNKTQRINSDFDKQIKRLRSTEN